MPLLDHLRIYREDLGPLLASGEEPFAMAAVSLAYGARRLERTPEDIDRSLRFAPRAVRKRAKARQRGDQPPGRRSFFDGLLDAIDPPWRWNGIDWHKVIGGVTASGHAGSYAYGFVDAVSDLQSLYCVITDRRLLVVRRQGTRDFSHVFEVPRSAIVTALRQGRGYSRGRVVVQFTDSSSVALHAGFVDGGRANRLVRALTGR